MRNSSAASMTRSSSSTSQRHPQLMTHSAISDGYDFNRARSSESTENTLAGKEAVSAPIPSSISSEASVSSYEDRGVPTTPKRMPPTPPRQNASPYRPQPASSRTAQDESSLLQPRSAPGQSFLSGQPFLRPSSWRHKEEEHQGSPVFRCNFFQEAPSRDHEDFYTIQRSYAFDEDDESDSEY
jgi:hypothetical protein